MTRIIVALFIACLFALTGCSGLTRSSTDTTGQTIKAKILLAMNQVKSFTLDTDVINRDCRKSPPFVNCKKGNFKEPKHVI